MNNYIKLRDMNNEQLHIELGKVITAIMGLERALEAVKTMDVQMYNYASNMDVRIKRDIEILTERKNTILVRIEQIS